MDKSESIKELASALSKAQAKMESAKMDADNPFFKSRYATLGSIIETAKPVLGEFGLSLSQFPISDANRVGVRTVLMHSSGEWIADEVHIPFGMDAKNLAQSAGQIISYLRRYSYASVLAMYAEEDVDGNGLEEQKPTKKTKAKPKGEIAWPQKFITNTTKHEAVPKNMTAQHAMNLLNLVAKTAGWNPFENGWDEFEQVIGLYRKHRVVAEQDGDKITPEEAMIRAVEEYKGVIVGGKE